MKSTGQCRWKPKSIVASVRASTRDALERAVNVAVDALTPANIEGWFRRAGMTYQFE